MLTSLNIKTLWLTSLAMLAFAANSLLCRLAMADGAMDAVSFTALRFVSGALALLLLFAIQQRRLPPLRSGKRSAVLGLSVYAVSFSYAYVWLEAGVGALILFGAVQLTMVGAALVSGRRLGKIQWTGLALACTGLALLLLPGAHQPSLTGVGVMALAGAGWGLYSLAGRNSSNPLEDTVVHFLYVSPLLLVVWLFRLPEVFVTLPGSLYALASGVFASAAGYTIWYAALPGLSAVQGGVVQLSVPVITAVGGVLWLSEPFGPGLAASTALTLTGIGLVLLARRER